MDYILADSDCNILGVFSGAMRCRIYLQTYLEDYFQKFQNSAFCKIIILTHPPEYEEDNNYNNSKLQVKEWYFNKESFREQLSFYLL